MGQKFEEYFWNVGKILRMTMHFGVNPILFNNDKKEFQLSMESMLYKVLNIVSIWLGCVMLIVYSDMIWLTTIVDFPSDISSFVRIHLIVVFTFNFGNLYISNMFRQYAGDICDILNSANRVVQLIEVSYSDKWTQKEKENEHVYVKRSSNLITFLHVGMFVEIVIFNLLIPPLYCVEVHKLMEQIVHQVESLLQISCVGTQYFSKLTLQILMVGICMLGQCYLSLRILAVMAIIFTKLIIWNYVISYKLWNNSKRKQNIESVSTHNLLLNMEDSFKIYQFTYLICHRCQSMYSTLFIIMETGAVLICSVELYFASINSGNVIERIGVGIALLVILVAILVPLYLVGFLQTRSIKIVQLWQRMYCDTHNSSHGNNECNVRILETLRPIGFGVFNLYIYDMEKGLRFVDTIVDKTIFLINAFPAQ